MYYLYISIRTYILLLYVYTDTKMVMMEEEEKKNKRNTFWWCARCTMQVALMMGGKIRVNSTMKKLENGMSKNWMAKKSYNAVAKATFSLWIQQLHIYIYTHAPYQMPCRCLMHKSAKLHRCKNRGTARFRCERQKKRTLERIRRKKIPFSFLFRRCWCKLAYNDVCCVLTIYTRMYT